MPRKQQGWITFQSSEEERRILEQYSQQSQRTKTEILRELVRSLTQSNAAEQTQAALQPSPIQPAKQTNLEPVELPEVELSGVELSDYNLELKAMKVSARNVLKGCVKRIVLGVVNAEVAIEIAPGVNLVSNITRASAERLELEEGKEVYAIIKSSSIMIARE